MADDKHYVPGDFYRIDDMSGFKVRSDKTRKMWYGTWRRDKSWEPRNAQDFVRGVRDYQNAPEPRPRQLNVFIGPLGTTLTADVVAQAILLPVVSSVRMLIGDALTIMLSNGIQFSTTVAALPTQTSIQISNPLPYAASSGAPILDLTAYSQPSLS